MKAISREPDPGAQEPLSPRTRFGAPIPRGIWALGFTSLFMDMSSELVHSLLPVFLVTTLGASALALGVLEGVSEAATLFVKTLNVEGVGGTPHEGHIIQPYRRMSDTELLTRQ